MEDKAKIERCKYSHPHFKCETVAINGSTGGRVNAM